jgi:hypothetical protein
MVFFVKGASTIAKDHIDDGVNIRWAGSVCMASGPRNHLRRIKGLAREGTTVAARMVVPAALCAGIETLIGGYTFFAIGAMWSAVRRHGATAARQVNLFA